MAPSKPPRKVAQYIEDAATSSDLLRILGNLKQEGRLLGDRQDELETMSRVAQNELIRMEHMADRGKDVENVRTRITLLLDEMDTIIHGRGATSIRTDENKAKSIPPKTPKAKTEIRKASDKLNEVFKSLEDRIKGISLHKRPNDQGLTEKIRDDLMRLEGLTNRESAIVISRRIRENLPKLADIMGIPMEELDEIDSSIDALETDKVSEALKQVDEIIDSLPPERRDEFLRRLLEKVKDEIPPNSEEVPMSAAG